MKRSALTDQERLVISNPHLEDGTSSFLRSILDGISDGVYFVDVCRRILLWNHAAEQLTGYSRDEVIGKCCSDNILNHVDDTGTALCQGPCPLLKVIRTGETVTNDVWLRHKDGHRKPVQVSARPLWNHDGNIIGAVETFSDSAEAKNNRTEIEKLKGLAFLDPLTETGNRRFINHELEKAIAGFKRYQVPAAVLSFDVDHFKEFNDQHGHDVGDQALLTVVMALKASLRATDQLGRMGGDEFIAVLDNASEQDLQAIGERCLNLIRSSLVCCNALELPIMVSVGGTFLREGDDTAAVLKRADEALYQSKETGRGRISIL